MKSANSEFRIAVLSDIHLGHRRNKTADIVANLDKAFPSNAETAELDMIVFAGDVFDDLLMMNNQDVIEINFWMARFLRMCRKLDICVRVLEGTPGHDWKQSNWFQYVNDGLGEIGADLEYVTDLCIRYEERFDKNFLFVPDEWDHKTENTLSQVRELLKAKGLEKVDYAIMHGQFDYQLPPHIQAQKHDSNAYLSIVKNLIFIGHVHTFSQKDRIIAQGSFDRLTHGEEGPKGHVRATIRPDDSYDIKFVETVDAKSFVTVNCLGLSMEETIRKLDAVARGLRDDSRIRVEAEETHSIFEGFVDLKLRHPLIEWDKKPLEDKSVDKVIEASEEDILFEPVIINRDTIYNLMQERLVTKNYDPELIEHGLQILKEVL